MRTTTGLFSNSIPAQSNNESQKLRKLQHLWNQYMERSITSLEYLERLAGFVAAGYVPQSEQEKTKYKTTMSSGGEAGRTTEAILQWLPEILLSLFALPGGQCSPLMQSTKSHAKDRSDVSMESQHSYAQIGKVLAGVGGECFGKLVGK